LLTKSIKNSYNYIDLKNQIILELSPFINEQTGRRPIILPVIMEVKEN
jgi:mRNA degradation ribonuclease J1/J2